MGNSLDASCNSGGGLGSNAEPCLLWHPGEYVDDWELERRTPFKRSTFQTLRSRGGGPPFIKSPSGTILYRWGDVVTWVGQPINSTSQYESKPHQKGRATRASSSDAVDFTVADKETI